MNLKKKLIILSAAGIMALSASPFVLAATPAPTDAAAPQATVAPAAGAAVSSNEASLTNDKYLTKGGAAFWFIFTIVLNGALSFWIGNRFYRLSKKDNHISSEIRALKRDIDDKFVKSVGGFAEQEVDINNLNESLAMDDDGIRMSDRPAMPVKEISPEEEERFRKWEEAQSKTRSAKTRQKDSYEESFDDDFESIKKSRRTVKEDFNEELDDVRKIRRKNYQPKRGEADEFDDDGDMGETKEIKLKGDGVKSKAKEILGDIFPFNED